jgi:hypothetical protein
VGVLAVVESRKDHMIVECESTEGGKGFGKAVARMIKENDETDADAQQLSLGLAIDALFRTISSMRPLRVSRQLTAWPWRPYRRDQPAQRCRR